MHSTRSFGLSSLLRAVLTGRRPISATLHFISLHQDRRITGIPDARSLTYTGHPDVGEHRIKSVSTGDLTHTCRQLLKMHSISPSYSAPDRQDVTAFPEDGRIRPKQTSTRTTRARANAARNGKREGTTASNGHSRPHTAAYGQTAPHGRAQGPPHPRPSSHNSQWPCYNAGCHVRACRSKGIPGFRTSVGWIRGLLIHGFGPAGSSDDLSKSGPG